MWSALGVEAPPDGVPSPLAIAVLVNGYTESETRRAIIEGGDENRADEWIEKLREKGYLQDHEHCSSVGVMGREEPSSQTEIDSGKDGGAILWAALNRELRQDESGFKHRVVTVDCCIKNNGILRDSDLPDLCCEEAGNFIPYSTIADDFPWNGCKFAAFAVMHLVSGTGAESKRNAARPVCRSLGGCSIPSAQELAQSRWPYILSDTFKKARHVATTTGTATALLISVTDVEVMRNPSKGFTQRPGTFAHSLVMTVSPAGVYIYQAYGPRGYTLLQNIRRHSKSGDGSTYPLSLEDGEAWVSRFEEFTGELNGSWTRKVNEAYSSCFEVDLVGLGCMRIGSQLDAYVTVNSVEFDADTVRKNFALLPLPDSREYPRCKDGAMATAKAAPLGYKPDGGVAQYYVPLILRCGRCGKSNSSSHMRCSRCKNVRYCSRECQLEDWSPRHKKACNKFKVDSCKK